MYSNCYYHVIARGNNKNEIFHVPQDYLTYLELVRKYKYEHPFELYHYALMPNHIHLLVKILSPSEFSKYMKQVGLSYYLYYNRIYTWTGHLWQGRFRSQYVGNDEYFLQCGKYIELNPLRANIVKSPELYNFSSYAFYAKGHFDDLLTEDPFYKEISPDKAIRAKLYRQMVCGDEVLRSYGDAAWGRREHLYEFRRRNRIRTNLLK